MNKSMDKILQIVKRKPLTFLFVSLGYGAAVILLKWQTAPPFGALWFALGAVVGTYFMDAAEIFFGLSPSPFRSIVFMGAFVVVSLFVATSSGSMLASGLVLALYLTLLLWQWGEWQIAGSLHSWYRMIATPVAKNTQLWVLSALAILFFVETWLFIRW